ncbi:GTA baseplate fiber-binding domain-containing protein [Paracoccus broussonetiae]
MGVTLEPLSRARPGVWDLGPPLRLKLKGGDTGSVSETALLGGANLLAIGDGSAEGWELLQFRDAKLLGAGIWEISTRLRGQAGTDAFIPEVWAAESVVVLLDGAASQVDLPPSARNQMRYWRIGPALRSPDDPSYRALSGAYRGAGLRPWTPCHLSVSGNRISWIRRTRIEGDGWEGPDVPLGEAREQYAARLVRNGAILLEAVLDAPQWNVPAESWNAAVSGGAFAVEIAQLSEVFGAGPHARMVING